MICKNCNKENEDGRKYCFYCGYDLTKVEKKINEKLSKENIVEDNYSKQKEVKGEQKGNKKGISGKTVALVCVISAAIITVSIAVIVTSMSKSTTLPSQFEKETIVYENNETETKEVQQLDSNASKTYSNINLKTDILDEQSLNNIERLLLKKSSTLKMNVKMILDDVKPSEIQDYADSKCKKECKSNGILFVKGSSDRAFAVSSTGKGNDYLPKNLKSKITKEAKDNASYMDFSEVISIAVETIPNKKSGAYLYTFDKVKNSNQVVYADSKKSKLTLIDWSGDSPKKMFETKNVYFGMDGVTKSPSEYKSATPKGTFKLGFAFSNHSLNTGLETLDVTSGMVWVDDPNSDYYNTVQYGPTNNPPKWSSAENTYAIFNGGTNYACILIEHNGDGYTKGVRGKGSAMYVAGKNTNIIRSYGDVNISANDMKSLLSYLDENENPYIVIS